MDHTTNLVYRQEAHEYVEIQNQDAYPGVYEEDPVAVKVFSALIVPALLLGFLLWFMRRAKAQSESALARANENTKVIAENNELLRENIAIQREILEAMRNSTH